MSSTSTKTPPSSTLSPTGLVSKFRHRNNFTFGTRALTLLKDLTGITTIKTHRNLNSGWSKFRKDRIRHNQQKRQPDPDNPAE